jgi:hypothetical protein
MEITSDTTSLISVLVTVIAVIITLITASQTVRSKTFEEQKVIVDRLQKDVADSKIELCQIKAELEVERRRRMDYELYIQALILLLRENKIVPPDIKEFLTVVPSAHI